MDHSEAVETAGRQNARSLLKETVWSPEFEVFVRRHSGRLAKSLALITFDRGLAEDAAQEAFLQLYLHWEEVRRMDAPGGLAVPGGNQSLQELPTHAASRGPLSGAAWWSLRPKRLLKLTGRGKSTLRLCSSLCRRVSEPRSHFATWPACRRRMTPRRWA